jgi:hypothetical protein
VMTVVFFYAMNSTDFFSVSIVSIHGYSHRTRLVSERC